MNIEPPSPAGRFPLLNTALTLLIGLTSPCSTTAQSEEKNSGVTPQIDDSAVNKDIYSWSTRVYQFPFRTLKDGADPESRGQLDFPVMPASDAKQAAIRDYIKECSKVLDNFFKGESIHLPPGSLAVADVDREIVAIRTTREGHGFLSIFINEYVNHRNKLLTFRVDMFEAETSEILPLLENAIEQVDHTPLIDHLESQIGNGKVRLLESNGFDTYPGQNVRIESGSSITYSDNSDRDEGKAEREASHLLCPVGTKVAILPIIDEFIPPSISFEYNLEYALALPTDRRTPVTGLNAKKTEVNVSDIHTSKLNTHIAMLSGQSRLMGVWQTPRVEKKGKLILNFLTSRIIAVQPEEDHLILKWLNEQGERVRRTPPLFLPGLDGDSDPRMVVRRFRSVTEHDQRAPKAPAKILDALRSQDIPFPKGSVAFYLAHLNEFVVRNYPENMKKVEEYFHRIYSYSFAPQIACQLHLVEAEGPTFRKLELASKGSTDHTKFWKGIEKEIAAGRARLLHTAWMEAFPGLPVTTSANTDCMKALDFGIDDADQADDGADKGNIRETTAELQNASVGLKWEIISVLRFDKTIDVQVDLYNYKAPPTKYPTQRLRSGMMQMIGPWKPKSDHEPEDKDTVQAVFLKAVVIELDSTPYAKAEPIFEQ